jgi:hypothetical protein
MAQKKAYMIYDYSVVMAEGITPLRFQMVDGLLYSFKNKDQKIFIACGQETSNLFKEEDKIGDNLYCSESDYFDYLLSKKSYEQIVKFEFTLPKLEEIKNVYVELKKIAILPPYTTFYNEEIFHFKFESIFLIPDKNQRIEIIKKLPNLNTNPYTTVSMNQVSHQFYNNNIGKVNNYINVAEKYDYTLSIAKISVTISNLYFYLYDYFKSDPDLTAIFTSISDTWVKNLPNYFSNYSIYDFQAYSTSILKFKDAVYQNQKAIKNSSTNSEIKLYWICKILPFEALSVLPTSLLLKLFILTIEHLKKHEVITIYENNTSSSSMIPISNTTSHMVPKFNEFDDKNLVINIIKASQTSQVNANAILLELNKIIYYEDTKPISALEFLYSEIKSFMKKFVGNDILKPFADAVYYCWIASEYYPYNIDGTIKSNLSPIIYGSKNIFIAYKHKNFRIYTSTNMDFEFENLGIRIFENNQVEGEIEDDEIAYTYGIHPSEIYNFFDTVCIKAQEDDVEDKIIFLTYIDSNNETYNVMPMFFLKFIDDMKYFNNLENGIKISAEIILTLSGFGNIGKLRHILHFTKAGRVALGLETAGAQLIKIEFARGIAGLIEITTSLVKITLDYIIQYKKEFCDITKSTYDSNKCEFFTILDNWMMAFQLLSGATDFIAGRILKSSAKRILANGIPSGVHPDAVEILYKFADEINTLKLNFLSHLQAKGLDDTCEIWQRLNKVTHPKYMSSIDKLDFLNDFKNATKSTLNKLNKSNGIDGELIDIWQSVVRLKNSRSKVKFLECLCEIKKDSNLLEHINDGHPYTFLDKDGNILYGLSGVHNPDWIDGINNLWVIPPPILHDIRGLGYQRSKIKQIINGVEYKKTAKTTMWPKFSNDPNICRKMINEEMAYAKMNMSNTHFDTIIKENNGIEEITYYYNSFASDGTVVILQKSAKGWSIYPQIQL